jgi:ABC-type uncharacterized transport system permease subunit
MQYDSQQALLIIDFMQSIQPIFRVLMVLFFGAAMVLDAAAIQGRNSEERWPDICRRAARSFFISALILSSSHLVLLVASPSGSFLNLALSGLACFIALIVVLIDRGSAQLRPLGFLTSAIVWALNVIAPFLDGSSASQIHSLPGLSLFHIVTALTGEALCMVAFSASLLYIWDYRRLKSHVLERRSFMPSLQTLDTVIGRVSLVGFLLISTSLASGVLLILDPELRSHLSVLKILWAFAVWGWYLLALVGRGFWGWTGRRGAHLSIWGSVLLGLTLFGTIWNLTGRGQS